MKFRCLAIAALLFPCIAAGQTIEAEGVASLDAGGMDKVRQLAVRDALYQASLSASAQVEGNSSLNAASEVRENINVRASGSATSHTILREWVNNGLLHVLIRAEVRDALSSSCGATSVPAKQRKKIAVTRFVSANSLQVEDIPDIWNGYPLELLRRLGMRGGVLPVNTSSSLLLGGSDPNPDSPSNRDLIRRIAEKTGSQLVISGIILDAGFCAETLRPYVGWSGNEKGRRSEIVLPWPSVAAGVRPEPSQRRLEVETFVHDGLTGALVSRHRHSGVATGRVTLSRDTPFASLAFFGTPYGEVVEQVLNHQADVISHDLNCLPFAANVVRIDGNRVYLDAGTTSGLAPGDKVTLYRRNAFAPVAGLSTADLGIPETPGATVSLTQVQPLFSIANLPSDAQTGVQVGDLARIAESTETPGAKTPQR